MPNLKHLITPSEVVGLTQKARARALASGLPITVRAIKVLKFDDDTGARRVNTVVQGEKGSWAIMFSGWNHEKMWMIRSAVRYYGRKTKRGPYIYRQTMATDFTVEYSIFGDAEKFTHDMALCRMFDDLIEVDA